MALGDVEDEASNSGHAEGARQCERGARVSRREQARHLDGQPREELGVAVVDRGQGPPEGQPHSLGVENSPVFCPNRACRRDAGLAEQGGAGQCGQADHVADR